MPDQSHPLHETTIEEKTLYDGSLLHVKYKTIELPNGQRAGREIVEHPGAVAMVPILPTGEIMLIRQFRTATQSVLYEIPAGTLEPDEDPLVAAVRELREEIGYRAEKLQKLGGIHVAPGYSTEYIHIYLATQLHHAPLAGDADELIMPHPVSMDEALTLIRDGRITDAKTVSGLLLAAQQMG
jgi:ADP-ribose pyrophosphatase